VEEEQMNITVNQTEGNVPVTVLKVHGDLDGSNYRELIDKGREVCDAGAQHLLLDMSDMPFMSSAGLVALHSITRLVQGEEPPDPDAGWAAFRAAGRERDTGAKQQHVKLFSPQPPVEKVLVQTGMSDVFEIYTDREKAVASF
jgi:anti-anti-sigma factor